MSKGLFNRLQNELDARQKSPGISMADILTLPSQLSGLVNWMMRKGDVSLAEVIEFLHADPSAAKEILADLIDKGFAREIDIRGKMSYRIRLAPKKGRDIPANLWSALDGKAEKEE